VDNPAPAYPPPLEAPIVVDSQTIYLELDTGATVSLLAHSTFERLWPGRPTQRMADSVSLWDGSRLRILGFVMVMVSWKGQVKQLPIHVIEGDGPSLLGRDWLSALSIRVTGLQPPTDVHAFRAAMPFDDFGTQAFPATVKWRGAGSSSRSDASTAA